MKNLENRHLGIDAVRFIASIAVVLIHTVSPQNVEFGVDTGGAVGQLCRFAVPFYFIASGYFLAKKGANVEYILQSVRRRIAPVFIVWLLIYLAFMGNTESLMTPTSIARLLITGGPAYHLWFLPALVFASIVALALRRFLGLRTALIATVLLYGVGLGVGTYAWNGPSRSLSPILCAPVFVCIGLWIPISRWQPDLKISLGILFLGGVGQLMEAYLLDTLHMSPFHKSDFVISTLPLGVGTFLVAMNLPLKARVTRTLAYFGIVSLGIYAIHLLFVIGLETLMQPSSFAGRALIAAMVVICSTGAALALSRIQVIRPLVA